MLNTEENYFRAGFQCAKARREHDEARAEHWRIWFNQALLIEAPEDRSEARRIWNDGYSQAQPTRRFEFFR